MNDNSFDINKACIDVPKSLPNIFHDLTRIAPPKAWPWKIDYDRILDEYERNGKHQLERNHIHQFYLASSKEDLLELHLVCDGCFLHAHVRFPFALLVKSEQNVSKETLQFYKLSESNESENFYSFEKLGSEDSASLKIHAVDHILSWSQIYSIPHESGQDLACKLSWIYQCAINALGKHQDRKLKTSAGGSFDQHIGTSPSVIKIFEILGFREEIDTKYLVPPSVTTSSSEALILKLGADELLVAIQKILPNLTSANTNMKVVPSAQSLNGFLKDTFMYSIHDNVSNPENAYEFTEVFGIPFNSSDSLILERTNHLFEKYPTYAPFYVDALEKLSHQRQSDDLLLSYTKKKSEGFWTYSEYKNALKVLQLKGYVDSSGQLTDVFYQQSENLSKEDVESLTIFAEANNLSSLSDQLIRKAITPKLSIHEAYSLLGVNNSDPLAITDDLLLESFMVLTQDDESLKLLYTNALRVVAEARKSDLIKQFLDTGQVQNINDRPRSPNTPVGLINTGNTCYLNSILQYYYAITPLRDAIRSVTEDELSDDSENRIFYGRNITKAEAGAAREFTQSLKLLFDSMSSTKFSAIAPPPKIVQYCLQTDESKSQQDPSECIDCIIMWLLISFSLNHSTSKAKADTVSSLFRGEFRQKLYLDSAHDAQTSEKKEEFNQLFIHLSRNGTSLYDALDRIFDPVLIEYKNESYIQQSSAVKLPEILQIQIQRTQYDRKRGVYKNNAMLNFPETLILDQYLESSDPEFLLAKKELLGLSIKKKDWLKKFDSLSTFLDSNVEKELLRIIDLVRDVDSIKKTELQEQLEYVLSCLRKQLEDIENEINTLQEKIDNIRNQFTNFKYSLFTVFMHSGSAQYGHYWILMKDFKTNQFRKYNDELVSLIEAEEVFQSKDGRSNPYMLAYVREDQRQKLIKAVTHELDTS